MKPNMPNLPLTLGLALGLHLPVYAGTEPPAVQPAPSNPGDWCSWLQNKPGTLYKSKENPFLQEFQLEGRLHIQTAYLDGNDVNDKDFSSRYNEFRRFRLGAKAKFLEYFSTRVSFDLVGDERIQSEPNSGLGWGYEQFDEAYISFDLGKALGETAFDTLSLTYGRQKYEPTHEARLSSNEILTIERSAITNKIFGSFRPTGLTLEATMDAWSFNASVYSSSTDGVEENDSFNGWQDSAFYQAGVGYKVSDELKLVANFIYNDADVTEGEDSILGYAWAGSLTAEYDSGPWGIVGEFIYGENGGERIGNDPDRSGDFWGFVAIPYYWILEEKLQLVGQYQYGGADEAEGIRINSRYGRVRGTGGTSGVDVNDGRGDEHHSFYGGLNYYLCGHNAKVMAGVEYQTLNTPAGGVDTLTYLLAFRTFF